MKLRWDTFCKALGLLLGKKICWLVLFMISDIAAMAQAYSQPNIDSISSGDSGTPSTQVEISESPAGTEDVADTSSIQAIPAESATKPESLPDTPGGKASPCRPCLFLKTNMLYDLLTFVNASVEVPFSEHLTAEATVVYPWWRDASRHKTIQMRYVAVTPRYYFSQDDMPYASFFAGLTIGGGEYDLQWTRRGVQGSMWHVSPVIGYSHHISKRWKMEYSASVGFVHTKYQKYTQTSNTPYGEIKVKDYPWVSKVLNTVLPTSLNVSIVYTFTKSKQIGHHEE